MVPQALFEESLTEGSFFAKPTYEVRIGIWSKSALYYTTCLVDTGEGPNLIIEAYLRPH